MAHPATLRPSLLVYNSKFDLRLRTILWWGHHSPSSKDTTLASTKLMMAISPAEPATACRSEIEDSEDSQKERRQPPIIQGLCAEVTDRQTAYSELLAAHQEQISIGVTRQLLSTQPCHCLQSLQSKIPHEFLPRVSRVAPLARFFKEKRMQNLTIGESLRQLQY